MRSCSQDYAALVFDSVEGFRRETDTQGGEARRKRYGSMAHKLPVLVRSAGLCQALAFVEARGKDEHRQLLEHLAKVVGHAGRGKLLEESRTSDLLEYMYLTRRVLEASVFFKRFAESVLKVAVTDEGDN